MYIDHDVVIRKWKPLRWALLFGITATIGLPITYYLSSGQMPYTFLSWQSLFVFVLITILSSVTLNLYTLFTNWLAPPHR